MAYVTEQTSAELRQHMRRLKGMAGWHDPLSDRLFREVEEQDDLNRTLLAALVLVWEKVLTEYHDKGSYVRQQVEAAMAKADASYAFLVRDETETEK